MVVLMVDRHGVFRFTIYQPLTAICAYSKRLIFKRLHLHQNKVPAIAGMAISSLHPPDFAMRPRLAIRSNALLFPPALETPAASVPHHMRRLTRRKPIALIFNDKAVSNLHAVKWPLVAVILNRHWDVGAYHVHGVISYSVCG
jgi:hypothetical protein